MMARWSAVWLIAAACGGDDAMPHPDAKLVAPILHVSGKAEEYGASGTTPLAGVRIGGYRSSDENTEVTYTVTAADGTYALDLETGGIAIDGYFKATKDTYMTTYLYPPGLVDQDFANARVALPMWTCPACFPRIPESAASITWRMP